MRARCFSGTLHRPRHRLGLRLRPNLRLRPGLRLWFGPELRLGTGLWFRSALRLWTDLRRLLPWRTHRLWCGGP